VVLWQFLWLVLPKGCHKNVSLQRKGPHLHPKGPSTR
jgi:hypothetical protein